MLKSPRDQRETFTLLAKLDKTADLDNFLDEVDWRGATPQQISYAVVGQLPLDIYHTGRVRYEFDAKSYFKSLLFAPSFQAGVVASLLNAFPERPRIFFVHIPKSGGTSVGEILEARGSAVVYSSALEPDWVVGRDFIDYIAKISRTILNDHEIHICGHYTLRSMVNSRLIRFGDKVWTIIRPPREIMVSFFNYILTTLESDPELIRPDSRYWTKTLKLTPEKGPWGTDDLARLLPQLLEAENFVPKDVLAHFTGDGTVASAIDLMAAADIEVVENAALDDWLAANWGVEQRRRSNVSKPFFVWNALSMEERQKIDGLIRQDLPLYSLIETSFAGNMSVRGSQIAARASGVTVNETAAPTSAARIRRAERPILRDPHFIDMPMIPPGQNVLARARLPSAYRGWADPPMDFKTIETTLQFPLLETRIRIRYARHERGLTTAALRWLHDTKQKISFRWLTTLLANVPKLTLK